MSIGKQIIVCFIGGITLNYYFGIGFWGCLLFGIIIGCFFNGGKHDDKSDK